MTGDYSIADIATFPWILISPYLVSIDEYTNIQRCIETMRSRKAVQTGMAILTPNFSSNYGTVA
ncbi:MAG: hypothetical protein QNJ49_19610 [Mastigocoleus sp. MO_167.B18]|nr:hypothetical protein [Mastigocoleus sp. MO_167.B18]